MADTNGSKLWLKILGPLVPLVLSGAIAYGVLKAEAEGLRRDLDKAAPQAVVDAQFQAVLRELQNINQRLDRMERRP